MVGTIYIVATPIGNLEDITLRAIRILNDVDIVLAEDTRVTRKLIKFLNKEHDIPEKKMISYHQHSGEAKRLEILNYLLNGMDLALVTDAGTPGISDPGNELIDFLISYNKEIKIVPVPGASAIVTALSVSGLKVNKFVFLGFLPKKKKNKLFKWIKEGKVSFAFYESPHRISKTLLTLEKVFGKERRIFIGRELTKMHETLYRGKIKNVRRIMEDTKIKGELVVVVEY
jgi:16S rRNA (cytidine1402-2'-O)-methyltransferase